MPVKHIKYVLSPSDLKPTAGDIWHHCYTFANRVQIWLELPSNRYKKENSVSFTIFRVAKYKKKIIQNLYCQGYRNRIQPCNKQYSQRQKHHHEIFFLYILHQKPINIFFIFKIYFLESSATESGAEGERAQRAEIDSSICWFIPPNDQINQSCVRLKLGARNSILLSHMCSRVPST